METVIFSSLFYLLQMSLMSYSLPIVDPGLFVIMGVRSCRSGNGYCMLGLDCTLDEDFLPDDEGGHCDGLRSAFTPSAHFICCRYNAINKTETNLLHTGEKPDITSTLSEQLSTFTSPTEIHTVTVEEENADIPTSTVIADIETTELSVKDRPMQARIEPDDFRDNVISNKNIGTVNAQLEIKVNDKKNQSRERNVDDSDGIDVEMRTEVSVSIGTVTKTISRRDATTGRSQTQLLVSTVPSVISLDAENMKYAETNSPDPSMNTQKQHFHIPSDTLLDNQSTSSYETYSTDLPRMVSSSENEFVGDSSYPSTDLDNSLFPVTTQKTKSTTENEEKSDNDDFTETKEDNEVNKSSDHQINIKYHSDDVSGENNGTNKAQEGDTKASSGNSSQSFINSTNPNRENKLTTIIPNKDHATSFFPLSENSPTTPQYAFPPVVKREEPNDQKVSHDTTSLPQHGGGNTQTEITDFTSAEILEDSSQIPVMETKTDVSLSTTENIFSEYTKFLPEEADNGNTIPSDIRNDHTENMKSPTYNPEISGQVSSSSTTEMSKSTATSDKIIERHGITLLPDTTLEKNENSASSHIPTVNNGNTTTEQIKTTTDDSTTLSFATLENKRGTMQSDTVGKDGSLTMSPAFTGSSECTKSSDVITEIDSSTTTSHTNSEIDKSLVSSDTTTELYRDSFHTTTVRHENTGSSNTIERLGSIPSIGTTGSETSTDAIARHGIIYSDINAETDTTIDITTEMPISTSTSDETTERPAITSFDKNTERPISSIFSHKITENPSSTFLDKTTKGHSNESRENTTETASSTSSDNSTEMLKSTTSSDTTTEKPISTSSIKTTERHNNESKERPNNTSSDNSTEMLKSTTSSDTNTGKPISTSSEKTTEMLKSTTSSDTTTEKPISTSSEKTTEMLKSTSSSDTNTGKPISTSSEKTTEMLKSTSSLDTTTEKPISTSSEKTTEMFKSTTSSDTNTGKPISTSSIKTTEKHNNESMERPNNTPSETTTEMLKSTTSSDTTTGKPISTSSIKTTERPNRTTNLDKTTERHSSTSMEISNSTTSSDKITEMPSSTSSDNSTEIPNNISSSKTTEAPISTSSLEGTTMEMPGSIIPDTDCGKFDSHNNSCWLVRFVTPSSSNDTMCVGSYLDSKTIVSSANCLSRFFDVGMTHVTLLSAGDAMTPSEMIHDVIVHEEYRNKGVQVLLNDLGLIRLKTDIKMSPAACALCLPSSEHELMDRSCETNEQLQNEDKQIGRPMVCQGTLLAGIASSYNPHPVYTPISDYLTWIRTNQIVPSITDGKWRKRESEW